MNRLKHLENRVRGWLPKEPDLSSFQKIAHSSIPQQQPFRVEGQAEKSLLDIIKYEIGTRPKLTFYFYAVVYPLVILFLVYVLFFSLHSSPYDGLSIAVRVWFLLIFLITGCQGIVQYRSKLKLEQELKKGLVNGAQGLLKYYDGFYASRRNFLLLDSAASLGVFAHWLVSSFTNYSMPYGAEFLMFILLGFGIVLVFIPFWDRRENKRKKARVQNLLNQIKLPYEV